MAKQTRAKVKALASSIGETQSPAYYDEIDGDIFLAKRGPTEAAVALPPVAPEIPRPAVTPMAAAKNFPVPAAPEPALVPAPEQGFIFANSDRVRLTPAMLRGLGADQLRIARNEIYARRGRFFRDPALAAHFSRFPWYRPHAWEVPLSAIEQANVSLIASLER